MRSPKNILRHELIGLDVAVVDAGNQSLIGLQGKIVNETRNTLELDTPKGRKTLLKGGIVLRMVIAGEAIRVEGKFLVGRSEDRIKK
jgi:ribonuclease P protein subunit POP4